MGFPAGRIAALIRKYLIERDLLVKSAFAVQPIDFSGISAAGGKSGIRDAAGPLFYRDALRQIAGWSTSVPLTAGRRGAINA
jgi:hypothetical protein